MLKIPNVADRVQGDETHVVSYLAYGTAYKSEFQKYLNLSLNLWKFNATGLRQQRKTEYLDGVATKQSQSHLWSAFHGHSVSNADMVQISKHLWSCSDDT